MYTPLCQTFFFWGGGELFLNLMVLLLLLYPLAISQEAKTGPGTVFINHSDVFVLSSLVSTENQGTKKKKNPIQVVQIYRLSKTWQMSSYWAKCKYPFFRGEKGFP